MIYLLQNEDTFTIFRDINIVPERLKSSLIELDELPPGEGILRRAEDGSFYYEPFPEPIPIEPIEPEPSESELIQAKILLNTEMLLIYKEIEMEMM